MRTAFLVDGGFFLIRYRRLKGTASPRQVARGLHAMCLEHLRKLGRHKRSLYRIFYYDCPPLTKKAHNPIDGKAIDFSKTSTAEWRLDLFKELRKLRKLAIRLGYLDEANAHWVLRKGLLEDLVKNKLTIADLKPEDAIYQARQKGVDMKIGLDIASMAFKGQVDQIVLVSGDSDFVSAAKLARREGIDFILDSMWSNIRGDLNEHIDGLQAVFPRPSPLVKTLASGMIAAAPAATTSTAPPTPLPPASSSS